jgi:transposase-like protein
MMRRRRRFDPEFTARVVLELLRGDRTVAQLCREHAVGADLIGNWRKILADRAPELFADPATRATAEASRIAELERLVGQQALELAAAKEALRWPVSHSGSGGR